VPAIPSAFTPPLLLRPAWLQTITPSLFRRLQPPVGRSENLELPDGDFLELEWHAPERSELLIASHGLEGSLESSYMIGLTRTLLASGYGVLTWNMRGCGRVRNRLPTWYHSGQSEDLRAVVSHALQKTSSTISLLGISVGGNITLKYLGEESGAVSGRLRSAIAVSVPMDLRASADTLATAKNAIYMQYLLRPLRARMLEKKSRFPGLFDLTGLSSIRTFHEFDRRFTAPMHGFASVDDYWDRSSSIHFAPSIRIPTLLISSLDDPFLSPSCFPHSIALKNPNLFLETPAHGGHVGFIESLDLEQTWLDRRAAAFFNEYHRERLPDELLKNRVGNSDSTGR
jgi:predicted alpha/beta-fold hydrolase